ncbi:MAG: nitrate/nitrite transporter NrtS [Novosphingobium sp.]|nr:nitrate/nitrite transporter NrtS [Novosphingobium sp.]
MLSAREALRRTFRPPIVTRSLMVALVVGTLLNLINQGPELWRGEHVVVWKLLLTFCVPFLVASYGALSALRSG